jgi:hypothetical protein
MKTWLLLSLLAVALVGCSGPAEPQGDPNAANSPTANTAPPANIGDGSAIAFSEWNDGVRKGTGKVTVGDETMDAVTATMELKTDGAFTLSAGTNTPDAPFYRFEGTWKKKDDKNVELTLAKVTLVAMNRPEGPTALDAEGTGTVTFMDATNPSEFALKGTTKDGKTVSLTFDVGE